jgi:hypothetical protein
MTKTQPRTTPTDTEFRVLHTLRVRGLVATADIAAELQLPQPATDSEMRHLEGCSLVLHRAGRVSGWTLAPTGRSRHVELLEQEQLGNAAQQALETAYDRFVRLNEPFKTLCTEWQMNQQPRRCITELQTIHPQVQALATTVTCLGRMTSYGRRFDTALQRLVAGDDTAFTAPLSNSYHDVWMQLHQDLLLTLRRERTAADGH